MSSDIVIAARGLTKSYRLFGHPGDRIKQFFSLGFRQYHHEFTALKDISFDIRKGETVGIVGRNGSGKSTLLQLVCGILRPSAGSIATNGSLSALLELGAGFNPEFTGRENVYFQGTLMGLSKSQMDGRFEEIIAFADIGEFIDQPVRTYSSGMFVRLAFAVAVHVDPDILVVDEALSIGDALFQHKSSRRVRELTGGGTSLLLVSHDRNLVTSSCQRCILLDNGRLTMDGTPADVFDYYYASIAATGNERISRNRLESGLMQVTAGTGEARVIKIRILDTIGNELDMAEVGMPVALEVHVRANKAVPSLVLAFVIRDRLGHSVFSTNTHNFGKRLVDVPAGAGFIFRFRFRANMGAGSYSISTLLVSSNDRFSDNYESRELACLFELSNQSHPVFAGTAWLDPELEIEAQ